MNRAIIGVQHHTDTGPYTAQGIQPQRRCAKVVQRLLVQTEGTADMARKQEDQRRCGAAGIEAPPQRKREGAPCRRQVFLTVKGAEQRLRRLGSTDVYVQNQIRGALHHGENRYAVFPLKAQQQMIGKEEKHHPVQVRGRAGQPAFQAGECLARAWPGGGKVQRAVFRKKGGHIAQHRHRKSNQGSTGGAGRAHPQTRHKHKIQRNADGVAIQGTARCQPPVVIAAQKVVEHIL